MKGKLGYFLLELIFILILIILIINGYLLLYNNYFNISISEKIKILLHIVQIIVITIGIIIGYKNYKELLRKNEGDHFPAIKINDEHFETIYECKKTEHKFGKDIFNISLDSIYQIFEIENITDNIIKIDLFNVYLTGASNNGELKYMMAINNSKFEQKANLNIKNNILNKLEKKEIKVRISKDVLEKNFSWVYEMKIILKLECYGIKKLIEFNFMDEEYENFCKGIKKDFCKEHNKYSFNFISFDYK